MVAPLPNEVAYALIERVGGRAVAERHGGALVQLAGGLPIQIVPASRALAYEARRGRLDRAELHISAEAQDSFRLVYETLDPSVRVLLHAAAFLNHERIVRTELRRHLEKAIKSDAEFERRLDTCLDLHLFEEEAGALRMHQLFASFLNRIPTDRTLKTKLKQVRGRQWQSFVALGRKVAANPADRELVSALLTYPLQPTEWEKAHVGYSGEDADELSDALAEIGRFVEAQVWGKRGGAEKERGDAQGRVDHQSLGSSLHHVGYCLSRMGKFEEALPWYERAVAEVKQGDVHGGTCQRL
jgi:tetratricopeptide (TPR) repeat protein